MGKTIDETGKKYGRLTVLRIGPQVGDRHTHWYVQCDCGEETLVNGRNLRTGHTQSCGCIHRERTSEVRLRALDGIRFGRWTVLRRGPNAGNRQPEWYVKCDCGQERLVLGGNLRGGVSQSCGCLKRELSSELLLKDETGTKHGRWTVLRRGPNSASGQTRWYVTCDCTPEKERLVHIASLRDGHSASCGCLKREKAVRRPSKPMGRISRAIPTGTRFGSWTVLGRGANFDRNCGRGPDGRRDYRWRVRCDCGQEALVASGSLLGGHSKSCGCYIGELLDTAAKNGLLSAYKSRAKRGGLSWGLSDGDFFMLTLQNCDYCGCAPGNVVNTRRKSGLKKGAEYVYNGIDQVDSSLGYEHDNCVPCCKICNLAKRNMPREEFIEWINRGHAHLSGGGGKTKPPDSRPAEPLMRRA